jgi:hypothetical protein
MFARGKLGDAVGFKVPHAWSPGGYEPFLPHASRNRELTPKKHLSDAAWGGGCGDHRVEPQRHHRYVGLLTIFCVPTSLDPLSSFSMNFQYGSYMFISSPNQLSLSPEKMIQNASDANFLILCVSSSYHNLVGGLEHEWILFPFLVGMMIQSNELHHFSGG